MKAIINNMTTRFSNEICSLSELQTILLQRPTEPKLLHTATILNVTEWRFIQRLPIRPSPGNAAMPVIQAILVDLATSHDRQVMFSVLSRAAEKILLLPVDFAGVERSFSAVNRILSSTRSD